MTLTLWATRCLDQLEFLVEQIQRAGLPVMLELEGQRAPLPAGVDLCAYRIIQEALTNALKHAGPARADVRIAYASDALDVRVRDDGQGRGTSATDGSGHGLIGMRERVALYGGEFAAGPCQAGGFEVHARLPLA